MAKVSFAKPKYCVVTISTDASGVETETYGEVKVMGKGISLNTTINTAESTLYADDGAAEYDSEFVDATITTVLDDAEDEVMADLTGCTVEKETGRVVNKSTDVAKYIREGGVIGRIKGGIKQYRAVVYSRIKYGVPGDSFNTKGQTTTFGTISLAGKLFKNHKNEWREMSGWKNDFEAAETELSAILKPTT